MKRRRLCITLLAGVGGIMVPGLATAQAGNAPASPPADAAQAASADQSGGAGSHDIIVTGSRVVTGKNSPTPLTAISTAQMLSVSPSTVVDVVNLVPALQGSQSSSSNSGGGQRNGAAAYINLRNMGDLRTLVLLDGQRVIPTINQMNADVDSWVIPQMLIQRVDVVTGGVSAVYGSDAISGVVNFVTDKNFNGLKMQASAGVSTYKDDGIQDIGVAAGSKLFGGRGHIEASYEFHHDPGIMDQTQRPFFAQSLGGAGLGTDASPYYNVTDTRFGNASFGGLIAGGPLSGLQFAQDGIVSPFEHGAPTGTANIESGGDGAWYKSTSIKSALTFQQAFGRFDYDVSNTTHFYLQGSYTHNHTQNSYRSPLEAVNIGYDNPYLSSIQQPYQSELQAQAALTPSGSFSFRRLIDIPATANQWTNTYMLMAGADGEVGAYKWDIHVDQSQSVLRAENEVNVDQGKFLAAANAVTDPATGQTVCHAALTNPNYSNCVPINLFGPTSITPQALDYVLAQTWNKNRTTLTDVNGSLRGAPFGTWAGPVNMALSGEWRRIGWSVTSNAGPNDPIDCGGIEFGCTSSTARWLQNTMPGLARVTQTVAEAAYEVDIPLAKDMPFLRQLNVNGAARYTHYSDSGAVWTWKLGLVWRPFNDLMLRGTASRDIRAPNLFELYAPTTIAPSTVNDPLTGTAGSVPVATVSNENLTPERARSFTAGFVWTPSFLPRFSLSVDGYWVKVDNAISQLAGNSSSVLNLCATTAGANPVCADVITRPHPYSDTSADNFPTMLYQKWLNIASFKTYGVDVEADYSTAIGGHALDLRALASYQPHLIFNQGPAGIIDLGNVATGVNLYPASPALKYTLFAQFSITDALKVSVLERGRGAMKAVGVIDGQPNKVFVDGKDRDPAATFTNLTLSYDFGNGDAGQKQIYFNVQNLFNKQSDVFYAGADSSPGTGLFGFFPPNGDDIVGRYYTVGVHLQF